MAEWLPTDTITLDHASTLLLIFATIFLLPVIFIMAVRVAVPTPYEPVLKGFNGTHMLFLGFSLLVLLVIIIVGYYRNVPPTRLKSEDPDEKPTELVVAALAVTVIGLPLFIMTTASFGGNISEDGWSFIHGIAALIPIFISLALVISGVAGFIEARKIARSSAE